MLPDYITVFQNPFAPLISQNGNVLSTSVASGYQWQLNGNDIPGATNQEYEITESGLYSIIISDANGCEAQSSIKAVYVGLHDMISASSVRIFPNPSSGVFTIEFLNPCPAGCGDALANQVLIRVLDVLGQEVYTSAIQFFSSSGKAQIDLDKIAPAVYLLEIEFPGSCTRRKVQIAE